MSIAEIITNISIHLMFLLIQPETGLPQAAIHFNTSHVSINRGGRQGNRPCQNISIHLMFLLIKNFIVFHVGGVLISIHLMFLLISEKRCKRRINNVISIHLMFLLIVLVSVRVHQNPPISIHLMFLLIIDSAPRYQSRKKFQYISCFY